MKHVLIVDDDTDSAASMRALIADDDFSVAVAHSLRDARRQMALQQPALVLLDIQLPDGSGMDLLKDADVVGDALVVLVTGHASLDTSIAALRHGATDYLVKPVQFPRLKKILAQLTALSPEPRPLSAEARDAALAPTMTAQGQFGRLWGRAPVMQRIYAQIARVAPTSITVFITGESGTGKEMAAQTLHDRSARSAKPFVAVNCGAISPNLMESEFFGHEKGSFTGADRQHQGFFERAAGGTLFLDEVTEMPLDLQVKLLRVLETSTFHRVGSAQSLQADVRIIAASNRCPFEAVKEGRLREDLLYRLNVFPLQMPPLRERLSDVPLLAEHFLRAISAQEGEPKKLGAAAIAQITSYRWPGNVRELRNAIQRAYVMAEGGVIDEEWLPKTGAGAPLAVMDVQEPAQIRPLAATAAAGDPDTPQPPAAEATLQLPVGISMATAERQLIEATLKECLYQKERTAAVLGISLKTLYNRLKGYTSPQ